MTKGLSVVIPIYNEESNIMELYSRLTQVIKYLKVEYDIIFVDDGSKDNSFNIIKEISKSDKRVRAIRFRKNYGQTAALTAGFNYASYETVVTMDGDLQNDPADIPRMIQKLNHGYDLVCGWRHQRKDPLFTKKIPSLLASFIRRRMGKDIIHDSGCTLKAFNKKSIKRLNLIGETHRFIPLILQKEGYKITEIKVQHHERKKGKTKYGVKRLWRGFFDMLSILFWYKYSTKPLHFFGGLGLSLILASILSIIYILIRVFLVLHIKLVVSPLLLASVMGIIIGMQLILFGFLGELQVKTYYSQNKEKNYEIEEIIN